MKTGDKGLALIERSEGCELKAYTCPGGKLTIGIGHTSEAGPPIVTKGMTITRGEAERILLSDLRGVEDAISRLVKVPLSQNQYDALVSFTFNLGEGNLARSTLLKKLNKGDYQAVPGELVKWNKAGGKVLRGLVARRAAEAVLWTEEDMEREDTVSVSNVRRDVPTIINKENIAAVAAVGGALGSANIDGNSPIGWALAILMVGAGAVFLYLFLRRRGA